MAKTNVHATLKRRPLLIRAWLLAGSLPVALCCAWLAGQAQAAGADDAWVPSMKAVHQKFQGERGPYAQFGDSITVSRAFWFGLKYARKNASAEMNKAAAVQPVPSTIFFQDKDNCRYQIDHPTIGKWTKHTMKVSGAKPLKKGHKVDDIFFFAGPPGSKTTRLMVDNVRLEGSGN